MRLASGEGSGRQDRDATIGRIGSVAAKLASHGVAVLVAASLPDRQARDRVRGRVGHFVQVHVGHLAGKLRRSQRQGLDAKALAGRLPQFTGGSDLRAAAGPGAGPAHRR